MRRGAVAGVTATVAVAAALLCQAGPPAPRALAASPPPVCVTSQLQPAPGIGQPLKGSVPVIFIHGITSSAAMWDAGSGLSMAGQAELIKGVRVWTFDYATDSLDWVDNRAIGQPFATAIACLARDSGHKVIVVAHSMGGLATQQAIGYQGSPAVGDVAELITIGTPYQGSVLLTAMQAVVSGAEDSVAPQYAMLAEALLSACAGIATHTASNPCSLVSVLRSQAGTALEWHSAQIAQLPPWPADLPVLDIAGDMRLRIPAGLLSVTGDFGDVPVSLGSATAHDTTGTAYVRRCPLITFSWPPSFGPCFHNNLPTDPDIIGVVLTAIRGVVARELSATTSPSSFPIQYPQDMTLACVQQYGPGTRAQWVDTVTPPAYGVQCFSGATQLGGLDLDQWCPAQAALLHYTSPAGWRSDNPDRYSPASPGVSPWQMWRCYQN